MGKNTTEDLEIKTHWKQPTPRTVSLGNCPWVVWNSFTINRCLHVQYIRQYSNLPPIAVLENLVNWIPETSNFMITDSNQWAPRILKPQTWVPWKQSYQVQIYAETQTSKVIHVKTSSSVIKQHLLADHHFDPTHHPSKSYPPFGTNRSPWFVGQFWDSMFLFPFWWDISELIYIVPWRGNQVLYSTPTGPRKSQPPQDLDRLGPSPQWTFASVEVNEGSLHWPFNEDPIPMTDPWEKLYIYLHVFVDLYGKLVGR